MTARGLPLDRIEMRCPTIDETSYLAIFRDIDVVLDSFPFTGHTMTCEALWMGVPVLTLRGDRPAGRLSASVLEALDLHDLIAETPKQYLANASSLASDDNHRAELRKELRSLMHCRLCDGTAFTGRLEMAYRSMWRQWCVQAGKYGGCGATTESIATERGSG